MEIVFIVSMLLMLLGLAFYLGRMWERMEWDGSFDEQESRPTKRAIDGATVSSIERDWSGEEEDKAWAHLQKPPRN